MAGTTPSARVKDVTKNGASLQSLDWFALRLCCLPASYWLRRNAALKVYQENPLIRLAVKIASPVLGTALNTADVPPRAVRKLRRYLVRMATRPTPFGLFAAVATGHFAASSSIKAGTVPSFIRARPDMEFVTELVRALEQNNEVLLNVRLRKNPAIVKSFGRAFLLSRYTADGPEATIRYSDAAELAFYHSENGISGAELQEILTRRWPESSQQIPEFLVSLVRLRFLLTDLMPLTTSLSPATWLWRRLKAVQAAAPLCEQIAEVLASCRELNRHFNDGAISEIHLPATVSTSTERVQVDSGLRLYESRLSALVAAEAAKAAELLLRLSPWTEGPPWLFKARQCFVERYGAGAEIPIRKLLDEIDFSAGSRFEYSSHSDRRASTLHSLVLDAAQNRSTIVELNDDNLALIEYQTPERGSLPISLDIAFSIAAKSARDIDDGRFLLVVSPVTGANAAGKMIGRFADILGPDIFNKLASINAAEQALCGPNSILAELIFHPSKARSANVIIRPNVRSHYIILDGSSSTEDDGCIPLDELYVGVGSGRFYLRWPKHDVEVVPRSGHMLNVRSAPTLVRFLAELACDGSRMLSRFNWGSADQLPFLPRLQYGRIVLSPARWRLTSSVLRTQNLDGWCTRWNVPQHVYLGGGDNRILLDLADGGDRSELLSELQTPGRQKTALLTEAIPCVSNVWAEGEAGKHACEIVVPLVCAAPRARVLASGTALTIDPPRKPGGNWLSLKLYMPPWLQDEIISGPLLEFCTQCLREDLCSLWFFVRYADPEKHIRVRFHGDRRMLMTELYPRVCDWFQSESLSACSRISIDTYEPETIRYGGEEGLAIAEQIFGYDSIATSSLLRHIRSLPPDVDKTALGVLTGYQLLSSLGLPAAAMSRWLKAYSSKSREVGDDYRSRKRLLIDLLRTGGCDLSVFQVLQQRIGAISDAGRSLAELELRQALRRPLEELYRSYLHMHYNRLLSAGGRSESHLLALLARATDSLTKIDAAAAPSR